MRARHNHGRSSLERKMAFGGVKNERERPELAYRRALQLRKQLVSWLSHEESPLRATRHWLCWA